MSTRYVPLSKSNRVIGLLNELEDAIAEEDSSVALWRLTADLTACARIARGRRELVEAQTRELERARTARPERPAKGGKPIKRKWLL